jgi:hypothetical protein
VILALGSLRTCYTFTKKKVPKISWLQQKKTLIFIFPQHIILVQCIIVIFLENVMTILLKKHM